MRIKKRLLVLKNALTHLWQTREDLSLRNIRKSHLHYTLSMVFCITLADLQFSYLIMDIQLWGLNSTTLLSIAYGTSAVVLLMLRPGHIKWLYRTSAIVTSAAFLLWFLLPPGPIKMLAAMLCWFGLGGCSASASLAYAFILRNAERLFSIIAVILSTGLLIFLYEKGFTGMFFTHILPLALLSAVVACLFRFRYEDFPDITATIPRPLPRGSVALMMCVVIYFMFNIFGESMIRVSGDRSLYALGMMLSTLFSVSIHLIFKRSVWHIWNLFLVCSALGVALMMSHQDSSLFHLGTFSFGVAMGMGLTAVFYVCAGMVKKFGSMAFLKRVIFSAVIVAMLHQMTSGILINLWPQVLPNVLSALATVSLLLFTLFSPLFYNSLFANDWLEEFQHLDISRSGERFSNLGLTPREKRVCELLLQGYTLRQISAILGIGYSTVNTYCTSLYRKLGINSRTELFVRFGAQTKAE